MQTCEEEPAIYKIVCCGVKLDQAVSYEGHIVADALGTRGDLTVVVVGHNEQQRRTIQSGEIALRAISPSHVLPCDSGRGQVADGHEGLMLRGGEGYGQDVIGELSVVEALDGKAQRALQGVTSLWHDEQSLVLVATLSDGKRLLRQGSCDTILRRKAQIPSDALVATLSDVRSTQQTLEHLLSEDSDLLFRIRCGERLKPLSKGGFVTLQDIAERIDKGKLWQGLGERIGLSRLTIEPLHLS